MLVNIKTTMHEEMEQRVDSEIIVRQIGQKLSHDVIYAVIVTVTTLYPFSSAISRQLLL